MKKWIPFGLLCVMLAAACGGPGEEEEPIIPDGKADGIGFDYGIYYFDSYFEYEGTAPLMVAFHNVRDGIPEKYAGHFDYAVFNDATEETDLHTGVFKLYKYGGKQRILLEAYNGKEVDRLDWTYAGGKLTMGDQSYYRLSQSKRSEVVRECEAFQVIEFEFEEGFTTWEYQSVYAEVDATGKKEVSIGACSFEEEDGDEIAYKFLPNGDFEATVTTEYDDVYVLRVPGQNPSRGEILFGDRGGDLKLMARLVCYAVEGDVGPRPDGFMVPLISEDDGHLLSQHNDMLQTAGKDLIPDTVFVSGDDAGRTEFSMWVDYIELLSEELEIDYPMSYVGPADYTTEKPDGTKVVFCYQGEVTAVPNGLVALSDNVMSDMFTLVSWKHGDVVGYSDFIEDDPESYRDWLDQELGSDWESRPAPGDAIVVAYGLSESEYLETATIERCPATSRD